MKSSTEPLSEELEARRIAELRRYAILDTPADGAFDAITALAAKIFHVPIAIVSLVDHDRIWFKSHHGLAVNEVTREPGLCASAILSPEFYQVVDAQVDVRTLTNPLVVGSMGFRFYAAAPLRTASGYNLGTLCVIDTAPRELTATESETLQLLSSLVMEQMELRLAARDVAEIEQDQRDLTDQLRNANRSLAESEQRFRDLFEEAPIPYVYEQMDSRFIRANGAAVRLLGLDPDDVANTYGLSLLASDAQQRGRMAIESVAGGTEAHGVALELRRKDDGRPLWVEWWSKPDAGGEFTRTMLVDVTSRVMLEQEQARLLAQNEYLVDEIRSAHNFGEIVGASLPLRRALNQVELVAPTDAAVLISGESGTGKELFARAIHERSPRKRRPLIAVNCGAIPEALFESEFFGHMRGSFTGAVRDKPGRFELADGGTLFLDEIGEIPLPMQAKLLRVLQEQEIERVGDTRTRKVDVRIVVATNRDLLADVDAGRFRKDLYYRLCVFPIAIPPLRERREDIPLLAAHFVRVASQKMNREAPRLTPAQAAQLSAHDWPGNIRELQNAVERAVILARHGPMEFALTPGVAAPQSTPSQVESGVVLLTRDALRAHERENIQAALALSNGKVFGPGGAAERLGMKATTLSSRIKSLGIKRG